MSLKVVKVGVRRGDTGLYAIEGLGDLILRNLDGYRINRMWAWSVMRVLIASGMSENEAETALNKADLEYDLLDRFNFLSCDGGYSDGVYTGV